ncbi:MAG TPA: hypothetical protein DCP97_03845 [Ruminococcaceae bacterium]|nr:hypothetical protein [Oscillospiraceae bacterium]
MSIGKPLNKLFSLLFASAILALIIFSGIYLADLARNSPLITKSRIVSAIILENGLSKFNIFKNQSAIKLAVRYAEAYAEAAITFENVPRQDIKNFLPIVTLSGNDIEIQSFRFEGHELIIYGDAKDYGSIDNFAESLKDVSGFKNISAHYYTDIDNVNRFEIECS